MGIVLIGIILILIGFIGMKMKNEDLMGVGFILGGTITFLAGVIALMRQSIGDFDTRYEELREELNVYQLVSDKSKISYHYISDLEQDMEHINNEIKTYRKYRNTFWLGWYFPSEIGDYKLFDIEKELKK